MQTWLIAIAVILVLQTTSAFLTRLVPIASPAFMAEFGWDEIWVGYLAAANIIGALFVLFTCTGLILRIGGVRALQICLLIGAASLLLLHVPSLALAVLASALIGLRNGAANPAGSEVLQRFTPDARRNFVFSIKQAGVPLGGVVAGLAIPLLIEALGWRTALLLAAAAAAVVTLAMWPFQSRIDEPRRGAGPGLHALTFNDLAVPLRSLMRGQGLMRIALAGTALSVAQACWFTFAVTYVVVGLGHSLSVAGLVFATMQATSVDGPHRGRLDRRPHRLQHHDARGRRRRVRAGDHPARPHQRRLAAVGDHRAGGVRGRRGVGLERRSGRRGGAPRAARAGRRDGVGQRDPGVPLPHRRAGRLRGVRRRHRAVRPGVRDGGRLQPGVPAAAVGD